MLNSTAAPTGLFTDDFQVTRCVWWRPDQVNEIQSVTTQEATQMTRRLAREEGIFGGTSSGANVVAAIRVARSLGPGAIVVTIIWDSGLRYLSTDAYREPD